MTSPSRSCACATGRSFTVLLNYQINSAKRSWGARAGPTLLRSHSFAYLFSSTKLPSISVFESTYGATTAGAGAFRTYIINACSQSYSLRIRKPKFHDHVCTKIDRARSRYIDRELMISITAPSLLPAAPVLSCTLPRMQRSRVRCRACNGAGLRLQGQPLQQVVVAPVLLVLAQVRSQLQNCC